jgi:hypothetical protein
MRSAQRQTQQVARAPALFLLALLAACAAGCQSVTVTPGQTPPGELRRIAFMPLDDSAAWRNVADYLFVGHTGARGASALLTRALGTAFAARGFDTVPDDDVRRRLWELKITPEAAARGDEALLQNVGQALKADLLVTGTITACKRSWVLFFPWSTVEFRIQALPPARGAPAWEAAAKSTRLWKDERDLFAALAERIAAETAGAAR